jgi:hypothetical protein
MVKQRLPERCRKPRKTGMGNPSAVKPPGAREAVYALGRRQNAGPGSVQVVVLNKMCPRSVPCHTMALKPVDHRTAQPA